MRGRASLLVGTVAARRQQDALARTAASAYHSIMLAFALLCCAGSVALSPSPDMCACGVAANRMSELPHKALLPAESHLVQLWCAWQARRTPG